jgi:hypothetical protein
VRRERERAYAHARTQQLHTTADKRLANDELWAHWCRCFRRENDGDYQTDGQMKRASRSPSWLFIILVFASSSCCQQRKCVKSTQTGRYNR